MDEYGARGYEVLGLSRELQIGKAAEHLVVADIILQGYSAFLADAGLPYDVVVDVDGALLRVQVKATMGGMPTRPHVYRFGLRAGKGVRRRQSGTADLFAFVALDTKAVAYVPSSVVSRPDGSYFLAVEFTSRSEPVRVGQRGKMQGYGRRLSDFASFADAVGARK